MTPDGTCFTHDARIDGIGKKRARDYTGELKSVASVNREFYHGPGTFPGKLPHQFDSNPRVSLFARALSGVGLYASKQKKCLLARRSLRDCFRLKFFFDSSSRRAKSLKMEKEKIAPRYYFVQILCKNVLYFFYLSTLFFVLFINF